MDNVPPERQAGTDERRRRPRVTPTQESKEEQGNSEKEPGVEGRCQVPFFPLTLTRVERRCFVRFKCLFYISNQASPAR